MSYSDDTPGKFVPAQLNYLTIYNPDLVTSESNELDQIVFYHSKTSRDRPKRRSRGSSSEAADSSSNAANEQLRQVGLAQGMVAFARDFSNGEPVDSIETEKRRIVLKELERGWWILASIDLTRLPNSKSTAPSSSSPSSVSASSVDYSSREVSPPALLIRQLQQAHGIFLLHHNRSLTDLYLHATRDKFCDLLDRFWSKFAVDWDVLLHGNPSVDMYGGIKLAAGGELGIGVGEEEWGSGERDVLEGLIRNTEGLVDLTVSHFQCPVEETQPVEKGWMQSFGQRDTVEAFPTKQQWLGSGQHPGPADGMIFSGLGVMTRSSLRSLTDWVTWIYIYGEDAYGIRESPNSSSKKRRRKKAQPQEQESTSVKESEDAMSTRPELACAKRPDIPRPIIPGSEESPKAETSSTARKTEAHENGYPHTQATATNAFGNSEVWVKYLTLGYGSLWGASSSQQQEIAEIKSKASSPGSEAKDTSTTNTKPQQAKLMQVTPVSPKATRLVIPPSSGGYFLVGLKGDLDAEDLATATDDEDVEVSLNEESGWNNRLSLRTIYLETWKDSSQSNDHEDEDRESDESQSSTKRLCVVIYVHAPFIYTLLFDPTSYSLSFSSFFHDLHHHLTPLHGPLLRSTSPKTIAARLQSVIPNAPSPVYDLVHSPRSLNTHCSIPNIPAPGTLASEGLPNILTSGTAFQSTPWTRLEALNVHSQIISTYIDSRRRAGEHERTAKTGKGWWIVWMRVPTTTTTSAMSPSTRPLSTTSGATSPLGPTGVPAFSEAILVRKASDQPPATRSWAGVSYGAAGSSSRRSTYGGASALQRLVGREGVAARADAAVAGGVGSSGRLSEGVGVGVDPRKYIEVLLSLCR